MVTSSSDMNEFVPFRQFQEVTLGSVFGGSWQTTEACIIFDEL